MGKEAGHPCAVTCVQKAPEAWLSHCSPSHGSPGGSEREQAPWPRCCNDDVPDHGGQAGRRERLRWGLLPQSESPGPTPTWEAWGWTGACILTASRMSAFTAREAHRSGGEIRVRTPARRCGVSGGERQEGAEEMRGLSLWAGMTDGGEGRKKRSPGFRPGGWGMAGSLTKQKEGEEKQCWGRECV